MTSKYQALLTMPKGIGIMRPKEYRSVKKGMKQNNKNNYI
jgi:hypothetical protein